MRQVMIFIITAVLIFLVLEVIRRIILLIIKTSAASREINNNVNFINEIGLMIPQFTFVSWTMYRLHFPNKKYNEVEINVIKKKVHKYIVKAVDKYITDENKDEILKKNYNLFDRAIEECIVTIINEEIDMFENE